MELMDYVVRVENVISNELCDELIQKFEDNSYQYEDISQSSADFSQIDILRYRTTWGNNSDELLGVFKDKLQEYKKKVGIVQGMWPREMKFENIRIKRYLPNDKDEFRPHVDVTSLENARRFLVFFLYLDDNKGGHTSFPLENKASPCAKGSLLMFPPMWPWLHAGTKPIDKPKYIIGSYLHYVN